MSLPTSSVVAAERRVSPQALTHHTLKALYDTLDGYADRMALRFAGPAALLGGLATWLLNWGRSPIPFGIDGFFNTVHDLCAYSIAGILLAFMLTTRRFLPGLTPEFYATTWFTMALLIVAVALHLLGSINTVGVELLAFAIGGSWFILFIKNVELFVEHINPSAATAAPSGAAL